jgi:hypothetical protein
MALMASFFFRSQPRERPFAYDDPGVALHVEKHLFDVAMGFPRLVGIVCVEPPERRSAFIRIALLVLRALPLLDAQRWLARRARRSRFTALAASALLTLRTTLT